MPVVLLCHFDGTNGSTSFVDSSPAARPLTAGSTAAISTTTPKFGTGSAEFSGNAAANIAIGGSTADFNFGSGPFTIEAWCYFTTLPGSSTRAIAAQWDFASANSWFFGWASNGYGLYYTPAGGTDVALVVGYTPPLNTWVHLAVDRDAANVIRIYANGAVVHSATVLSSFSASSLTPRIGNAETLNRNFQGRLDDLRIIKGEAMYGGAFTPPTAPLPDVMPVGTLRASMVARETLLTVPSALRVGLVAREALIHDTSTSLAARSLVREVVTAREGDLRVRGLVREVVRSRDTIAELLVRGLVREVVRTEDAPAVVELQTAVTVIS